MVLLSSSILDVGHDVGEDLGLRLDLGDQLGVGDGVQYVVDGGHDVGEALGLCLDRGDQCGIDDVDVLFNYGNTVVEAEIWAVMLSSLVVVFPSVATMTSPMSATCSGDVVLMTGHRGQQPTDVPEYHH